MIFFFFFFFFFVCLIDFDLEYDLGPFKHDLLCFKMPVQFTNK